jgi:hypothetical protein
LNPYENTTYICYSGNKKYLFSVSDLIHIFENALTKLDYNYNLDINLPKNPYTNIRFSELELYNIKFHILQTNVILSLPIYLFFLERFNVFQLRITHYNALLKYAIKRYIMNPLNLCPNIEREMWHMIHSNLYTMKWTIHESFPKDKLIKIMKPYIYLYVIIEYGELTDTQFFFYNSILYRSLTLFWEYNPRFGSKKITVSPGNGIFKRGKPVITYDEDHITISVKEL